MESEDTSSTPLVDQNSANRSQSLDASKQGMQNDEERLNNTLSGEIVSVPDLVNDGTDNRRQSRRKA